MLPQVVKFRKMAETLTKRIATLRKPRQENTPKRQLQAKSAWIEANCLERVKKACEALADAYEREILPLDLTVITTRGQLITMLSTKLDHSGGYYSLHDTGEFHDQRPLAVSLRLLMDGFRPEDKQKQEQEAQRILIKETEQRLTGYGEFYPTPHDVVPRVIQLAEIQPGMTVLEPSAGSGRLAKAAQDAGGTVLCYELNATLVELLQKQKLKVLQGDFLEYEQATEARKFQRIVMNPPFGYGGDIKHITHALQFLCPEGRLVSVVADGPRQRATFSGAEWYPLERKTFSESGTNVSTAIIVIDKNWKRPLCESHQSED